MSATWDSQAEKTDPIAADEVLIIDTEDSRNQKRATLSSLVSLNEIFTWTNNHSAAGFDLLNVGGIQINNPSDTFQYIVTPAAITADRILNLPLLAGTDTLVTAAFAQTLTNKTITAAGNTLTIASTDLTDTASIARSTDNLSFFSSTTSSQLAGIISDETGFGSLVFGTSPTIDTPTFTGDITADTLILSGDLVVNGTTTTVNTETVNVSDNHFYMNSGYTTTAAQTGGLVVNFLPTSTGDLVTSGAFVAGVASTSNPTVSTVGTAVFSTGDLVQISGSNNNENDGLFEVLSHATNILTIRGVGIAATVEDFTDNQFIDNASDNAMINKVNVSVIRSGTDGLWETAEGSVTGFTFVDNVIIGLSSQITIGTEVTGASTDLTDTASIVYNNQANTYTGGGTQDFGTSNLIVNTNTLFVDSANSRVGIGVTSPTEVFEVFTDTDITGIIGNARLGNVSSSLIDWAGFMHNDQSQNATDYALIQNSSGRTLLNSASGQDLAFRIGNSTKLHIEGDNGNVGIGTNSPAEKLTLEGGTFLQTSVDPTFEGSLLDSTNLNAAASVYVSGNYAYVASRASNSLAIVNISDPASPTLTGSLIDAINMDDATSVYVSGNYAYVVSLISDSLAIIDISNPASPTLTGIISSGSIMNGALSVYVSGNYAYVAGNSGNSLAIIDISNPASPIIVGSLIDATNMFGASSVYVSGTHAYVAGEFSHSLAIIDISDPTTPTLTGSLIDATNMNGALSVYVSGNHAYVASLFSDSLAIVDISDPTTPTLTGSLLDSTNMNGAASVYVSGNFAYVVSGVNGSIAIVDISDSTSPTLTGSLFDGTNLSGADSVHVSGKFAYVASADSNSLTVIDISGIDVPAANIGTIQTSTLDVTENAIIGNNLHSSSLSVGNNALIGGDLAVSGSTSNINGILDATARLVVNIYSIDDFPDPVSTVITLDVNTRYVLNVSLITSNTFNFSNGSQLESINGTVNFLGYSGSGTFLSGTDLTRASLDRITIVSFFSGATCFNIVGDGTGILSFSDLIISSFDTVGTVSGWEAFIPLNFLAQGFDTGLIIDNVEFTSCDNLFFTSSPSASSAASLINITGGVTTAVSVRNSVLNATSPVSIFNVSPTINANANVIINSVQTPGDGDFFESGTTGAITAFADTGLSSISITSVTSDEGAKFNSTAHGLEVGDNITHTVFTESTYLGTFTVILVDSVNQYTISADGIGGASVVFVVDETGTGQNNRTTVTSTAHGLSTETSILIKDTTNYDAGFTVKNALTNTFEIRIAFIADDATGTWDTGSLIKTEPRMNVQLSQPQTSSKDIVTAFVNDNTVSNGTIVNGTFTDMVFGTTGSALVAGTTLERWKLIDEVNGVFEYLGLGTFDGAITYDFTAESSGGTVKFRFKWQKSTDGGSVFNDFDDPVIGSVSVGSDAQSTSKHFPMTATIGDQIKPQITRDSGSSGITITFATIYGMG